MSGLREALAGPLAGMAEYNQFINWKLVNGRKIPCNPAGYGVSVTDPSQWYGAETALASEYAVGFVFTELDPFFFLDVDKAHDGAKWSTLAIEITRKFKGAAVEVSQSKRGLHIFGLGSPPPHGNRNQPLGLELYTKQRFVALTGLNVSGSVLTDHTAALSDAVALYFPAKPGGVANPSEWTTEPLPEWRGPEDDDELIGRAMRAMSTAAAFGDALSFADVWDGNSDALSRAFPDPLGKRDYDGSGADASLAQRLAWWTGGNCERIQRLMLKSGLYREKYEREDYLQRTISHAVGLLTDCYQERVDVPSPPPVEAPTSAPSSGAAEGKILGGSSQYMPLSGQLDHFRGVVYIRDLHKALVPDGAILAPEPFNVVYGGWNFAMDNGNESTTPLAWQAFTRSRGIKFPKVEAPAFRPELAPGQQFSEGGIRLVNTFVPLAMPRKVGDAAPFTNHLRLMLPDERDYTISLSYLAAMVQHIGVKFRWAVLWQGVQGNGKTLLTKCIEHSIGRKYTHRPLAKKLAKDFNAWMSNKLAVFVDDIFVPDHKQEIIEVLKVLITEDGVEIEGKGDNQVMNDNRANFIFTSNHRDAVRLTADERRFAIFYTAQQAYADLARDGMDPNGPYFTNLIKWLQADGYAIVHEYLATYPIPDEFNPATNCIRAPFTSTTTEVLRESIGGLEQFVMAAVDSGQSGFRGGWINSFALENLLIAKKADRAVPPNKRALFMTHLGYGRHPALKGGRVNNPIAGDPGKAVLYIKDGHKNAGPMLKCAKVIELYTAAQIVKEEF